jgi:23S rRNA (cytosine1962-C5)-methyltransferase
MSDQPLSVERGSPRLGPVTSRARPRAKTLALAKALERVVAGGHPWIFRDALTGDLPEPGEVVTVLDRKRRFLARGLAERGAIGVRVLTTEDRPVDRELFAERLDAALELRRRLAPPATDALRLVHGEGDGLPGVVVDRYAGHAVLRYDGAAIRRWSATVEELLRERLAGLGVHALLRRSGRGESKEVVPLVGELPDEAIEIREHGMGLLVDLARGQKTGAFLDHRPNRLRVRELVGGLVAAGLAPRVANLFGYTGGFSIAAGLGGADKVITVDVAAPALALATRAWQLNELPPARHYGAAVEVERWLAEQRRDFDLVIADPPSFAPSRATRERGLSAYRALHAAALPVVAEGGLYLAASCSSQVDRAAFEDTLRTGARAAGVELTVIERGGAGFDHPIPLGFPEGEYLVATLCRVRRNG